MRDKPVGGREFIQPSAGEKCEQAGVEIAYDESPSSIVKRSDGWQVDCVGFGTRRRVLVKHGAIVPTV